LLDQAMFALNLLTFIPLFVLSFQHKCGTFIIALERFQHYQWSL
jgi:hypothetical protein